MLLEGLRVGGILRVPTPQISVPKADWLRSSFESALYARFIRF